MPFRQQHTIAPQALPADLTGGGCIPNRYSRQASGAQMRIHAYTSAQVDRPLDNWMDSQLAARTHESRQTCMCACMRLHARAQTMHLRALACTRIGAHEQHMCRYPHQCKPADSSPARATGCPTTTQSANCKTPYTLRHNQHQLRTLASRTGKCCTPTSLNPRWVQQVPASRLELAACVDNSKPPAAHCRRKQPGALVPQSWCFEAGHVMWHIPFALSSFHTLLHAQLHTHL